MILQQPIEREQMKKLLATGRPICCTGFISKTRRPFKAFLVKQPDGKIGFEFEPRAKDKPAEKPAEEAGRPRRTRRRRRESQPRRRGSARRARWTR